MCSTSFFLEGNFGDPSKEKVILEQTIRRGILTPTLLKILPEK